MGIVGLCLYSYSLLNASGDQRFPLPCARYKYIYMLRSIVLDNSGETRCVCVERQVVGFPVADNDRDPGHEAIRGCFV